MKKIQNYVDGRLLEPAGGKYLDNYDPSRGKVYSLIPDSSKIAIFTTENKNFDSECSICF